MVPAFRIFFQRVIFIPDLCGIQHLQRRILQRQKQTDHQHPRGEIPPQFHPPFRPRIKPCKENTARHTEKNIDRPDIKPQIPQGKNRIDLKKSDVAEDLFGHIGSCDQKAEIIECLREKKEGFKNPDQCYAEGFSDRKIKQYRGKSCSAEKTEQILRHRFQSQNHPIERSHRIDQKKQPQEKRWIFLQKRYVHFYHFILPAFHPDSVFRNPPLLRS